MLHIHDAASKAHVLALDLDPNLRTLLTRQIDSLVTAAYDLTDSTEFLIVEPGDTEEGITSRIGLSPLMEPISGCRFGSPGFSAHWDLLTTHRGWFEMVFTFGAEFAYILFIRNVSGTLPELLALCRSHAAWRRRSTGSPTNHID